MAKTRTTRKFSDDEREVIALAANAVWNAIGYDVLRAIADEKGGDPERAEVSRRDVIEMVLDASRLEEQLRETRGVDKAFVARVTEDIYGERSEIEAFLKKDVFTSSRYGM
ncbi:MAG TPA: hypothetical protein VFN64_09585 [Burkholderiaceae bacterium]|nr:hypothetical protein [Burkholderiaceae bacterium]